MSRKRWIATEIEIHSPAAVVWKVVTNFPRYASWNPFIRHIEGELIIGERLKVVARLPCGIPMIVWPTILEVGDEARIKWLGSLILPGLLDGEHLFMLEPLGNTKVRFVQREEYSGLLVSMMWGWLREQGQKAFEMMNAALKIEAERVYESFFR